MKKIVFGVLMVFLFNSCVFADGNIKDPNVSGTFYDANPKRLASMIDGFMQAAQTKPLETKISILISPHAGYVYSGPVAAYGFKAISTQKYSTIVIVSPTHHFGFEGVAVWPEGGFKTPLGVAAVDESFSRELMAASSKIKPEPKAFDQEHALEVQIPFLQNTFKDFKIVPLIMGQPDFGVCEDLATALNKVIGKRDDVLVLISTDMSHFHGYDTAEKIDQATLAAIKSFQPKLLWDQCAIRNMELCGFQGVVTALLLAQQRWIDGVDILTYANSGDVTGEKSRVVGYSSIIFYKKMKEAAAPSSQENSSTDHQVSTENTKDQNKGEDVSQEKVPSLSLEQKKTLIAIARTTIDQYVKENKMFEPQETDPRLLLSEGAFVTLKKHGELRGCIGNIIGRGPLFKTVRDMAIAAATQDPRFVPVKISELKDIEVEISVLSQPRPIKNLDEFNIGVHGAIVSQGMHHQGVFLPQVGTEQGWTKEEFFSNLCAHKAGLPADAWKDPKTKIEIFSAEVFSEKELP